VTAQAGPLARLCLDPASGQEVCLDFGAGTSLAIELDFDGPQPRHFAAPAAIARPYVAGTFEGDVRRGASCNCHSITLVPHCNGTHTESAGHLTTHSQPLHRFVPTAPLPALLLSLTPEVAAPDGEDSLPPPQPGDRLVTAAALRAAWPATLPFAPRALVIRTLPNLASKRFHDYSDENPAYLSRQAVAELVARGIEHLVLDLPSLDRSQDEGRLTGHRLFFGLPAHSTELADATRAQCTITEFAFMPDTLADGAYALQLQLPALAGDAVPSRPILFPLVTP
jgi:kynurenine formamidase